jgi:hypothetical protein
MKKYKIKSNDDDDDEDKGRKIEDITDDCDVNKKRLISKILFIKLIVF